MLKFENLRLGLRVRLSLYQGTGRYIIKRIDTEQRTVFIVPDQKAASSRNFCMQWASGDTLYKGN